MTHAKGIRMRLKEGDLNIDYQAQTATYYPEGMHVFMGGAVGIGQPKEIVVSYEVTATWLEDGATWWTTIYGIPSEKSDDLQKLIDSPWVIREVKYEAGGEVARARHQELVNLMGKPQPCPPQLGAQLLALKARREVKMPGDGAEEIRPSPQSP